MIVSAEGGIRIKLTVEKGHATDVTIASTRAVQAARVLEGRKAEDALHLVPMLFSVCGTAQALAARTAMEAALTVAPAPEARRARRQALLAETVGEHVLAILRDWAVLLGEEPDLVPVRALRSAFARRAVAEARAIAEHAVFGGAAQPILSSPQAFADWATTGVSPAARLIRRLTAARLERLGASGIGLLPEGAPPRLEAALAGDAHFSARPLWQGVPCETGPLARCRADPLIASLLNEHGNGALARLAARLVDLGACLSELAPCPPEQPLPLPAASGSGLGWVEAARGLLVHRIILEDGVVRSWRVLAPTEWNFHPEGPLAQGLREADLAEDAEWKARLCIAALDPCVGVALEIAHA